MSLNGLFIVARNQSVFIPYSQLWTVEVLSFVDNPVDISAIPKPFHN